jgi:hypothetical protein
MSLSLALHGTNVGTPIEKRFLTPRDQPLCSAGHRRTRDSSTITDIELARELFATDQAGRAVRFSDAH